MKQELEEVTNEFAGICSKLGGAFDASELFDGVDMFCTIKDRELELEYHSDSVSVLTVRNTETPKFEITIPLH